MLRCGKLRLSHVALAGATASWQTIENSQRKGQIYQWLWSKSILLALAWSVSNQIAVFHPVPNQVIIVIGMENGSLKRCLFAAIRGWGFVVGQLFWIPMGLSERNMKLQAALEVPGIWAFSLRESAALVATWVFQNSQVLTKPAKPGWVKWNLCHLHRMNRLQLLAML